MYKNSKPKKSHKKLFLIVPVVVVVSAVAMLALEFSGVINLYPHGTVANTADSIPTGEIPSTNPTNTVDYSPANPSDDQPVTDKTSNTSTPPVNSGISATITSTRKNSAGTAFLIKVAVLGTESGSCSATMSRGDKQFSAYGSITLSAGQYSCQGLEIPLSNLDESGDWEISVTVTDSAGATYTTTSRGTI